MVFVSALDEKTAQFNFASLSHLVYNWMQGTSPLTRKKNSVRLTFGSGRMRDDSITSQTAKSISADKSESFCILYKILGNFSPTPP